MVTRYRPNAKLTLVIVFLVLVAGLSSNPVNEWPLKTHQVLYIVMTLALGGLLYLSQRLYSYFEIRTTDRGKELIRRQGVFVRRCPVDTIYVIENNNWVIPTLLIKYKNGADAGALPLTLSAYETEVAVQLLRDLLASNSEITVDAKTKAMLARK
jgi:hypothetical protein